MQKVGTRNQKDVAGVKAESGWGGAPSVRRLFRDERNVKAILELEGTKVGKMPSRVLLAGGPDLEEVDMDTVSLQVLEEAEAETDVSASEEEDGPGPPL